RPQNSRRGCGTTWGRVCRDGSRHGSCSETVGRTLDFRLELLANNNVIMCHSRITLRKVRIYYNSASDKTASPVSQCNRRGDAARCSAGGDAVVRVVDLQFALAQEHRSAHGLGFSRQPDSLNRREVLYDAGTADPV